MEEESSLGGILKTGAGLRSSPPARLSLLSKQISLLSFTATRLSPGCLELPASPASPPKTPPALLTQGCAGGSGSERGQSWRGECWALVLGVTFLKEGMSLHLLQPHLFWD